MKPIPSAVKWSIALRKLSIPVIILLIGFFNLGKFLASLDLYAVFMLNKHSPITKGRVLERWDEEKTDAGYVIFYGYAYEFYSPSGEHISATSYSPKPLYHTGDTVQIRYNENEPRINRIAGMRNNANTGMYLGLGIVLIFASFVAEFYTKYFQTIRTLKNRHLTYGKFLRKEKTFLESRGGETIVFTFYFRFISSKGKQITSYVRTHNTKALEGNSKKLLAYHKNEPASIVLIDLLPETARKYFYEEYEKESSPIKLN